MYAIGSTMRAFEARPGPLVHRWLTNELLTVLRWRLPVPLILWVSFVYF